MKIVIGIVGKPSAGKGTVTKILYACAKEANATSSHHSSGDLLRDTLAIWSIPADRANLQRLAQIMDADTGFGKGSISRAVQAKIVEDPSDIVIADGMRWKSDEEMLRAIPGSVVLYIETDEKIRYERMRTRERVGEKYKTWEEFVAEEKHGTETYIPEFGSHADWKIENNGTAEELEAKVREFFEKKVLPLLQSGK